MKKFIALTLALIMSFSCFSLVSFAEETETTEHLTEAPEGYIGVYTIEDLYCVRNDLAANYILMNDIDLSEATAEGGDWDYEGRGWNPIGSDDVYSNLEFSGVFDGNNYSIIGMNIDIKSLPAGAKNTVYFGLFSNVSGTVRNLSVYGNINAKINSYRMIAGGIAAYCTGTIENCLSSVYINLNPNINTSYSPCAGGIVGEASGAKIINCINIAEVYTYFYYQYISSYRSYSGGIVGKSSSSTIDNCINTGDIFSDGYIYNTYASGITSTYNDKINNCINLGNIYGTYFASGISTYLYADNDSKTYTTLVNTNSYNMGMVIASRFLECAISNLGSKNCYYLNGTGSSSTGATSLTETQMKLKSMYSGWDFDTVWTMEGREDYPYPELRDVPLVLPEDSKTEITGTVTVTGEAKVGSTLTAEIKDISPADSTFEYEWKADGEVVGTDTSYTITQDDVGKEITLTIKGNGEFKGEFSSSAIVGECVHSLGEYVNNNDATCEKNETKSAVCEKCSEILTEEIEGTKLPHSFKNYIYDENATCTADGTETAKCENCDATDTIIAENTMVEHVFSDSWTIDKEATCVEEGVKSHHCKNCNATKDESVLNKLAHIYDAEVTEATCDKDGKVVYTCSCGDTYSKVLYATGHKDNDGNGRCDECPEYIEDSENENENKPDCKCICHETGIHSFLYRIFSYIQRYFKIDLIGKVFKLGQICKCGEYHY